MLASPIAIVALLGTSLTTHMIATASPPQWMLLARHGECADVASLKRKIPDLGDIADPYRFAEFLRAKGETVDWVERRETKGKWVEVSVPSRALQLIFVASSFCTQRLEK